MHSVQFLPYVLTLNAVRDVRISSREDDSSQHNVPPSTHPSQKTRKHDLGYPVSSGGDGIHALIYRQRPLEGAIPSHVRNSPRSRELNS